MVSFWLSPASLSWDRLPLTKISGQTEAVVMKSRARDDE